MNSQSVKPREAPKRNAAPMQKYSPLSGAKYLLEPETSTLLEITGRNGAETRKPIGKYCCSVVALPEGDTSLAKVQSLAGCILEKGQATKITVLDPEGKVRLEGRTQDPKLTSLMLEFHLFTPLGEPRIADLSSK